MAIRPPLPHRAHAHHLHLGDRKAQQKPTATPPAHANPTGMRGGVIGNQINTATQPQDVFTAAPPAAPKLPQLTVPTTTTPPATGTAAPLPDSFLNGTGGGGNPTTTVQGQLLSIQGGGGMAGGVIGNSR
jgi:hypothetical protein